MQGRTVNPLVAVAGITAAALAVVGVLGVLAARSDPAPKRTAAAGSTKPPLPSPTPVAQRKPATSTALPTGTGTGRRIVYALGIHRLWAVGANGRVQRTYQAMPDQPPLPSGTYTVYAKKPTVPVGTATEDRVRYVLRMEQGKGGGSELGFCSIPLTASGKPAKPSGQGGIEASGVPCIQQKVADARYLWKVAPIGTKVVVIP